MNFFCARVSRSEKVGLSHGLSHRSDLLQMAAGPDGRTIFHRDLTVANDASRLRRGPVGGESEMSG